MRKKRHSAEEIVNKLREARSEVTPPRVAFSARPDWNVRLDDRQEFSRNKHPCYVASPFDMTGSNQDAIVLGVLSRTGRWCEARTSTLVRCALESLIPRSHTHNLGRTDGRTRWRLKDLDTLAFGSTQSVRRAWPKTRAQRNSVQSTLRQSKFRDD